MKYLTSVSHRLSKFEILVQFTIGINRYWKPKAPLYLLTKSQSSLPSVIDQRKARKKKKKNTGNDLKSFSRFISHIFMCDIIKDRMCITTIRKTYTGYISGYRSEGSHFIARESNKRHALLPMEQETC